MLVITRDLDKELVDLGLNEDQVKKVRQWVLNYPIQVIDVSNIAIKMTSAAVIVTPNQNI